MTLIVHVEGHTEESFVNEVLAPHLGNHGFATIRAGFIGGMQGGITSWTVAQRDIVNHLRDDPTCIATTMVDYYGLPQAGATAWPGRAEAAELPLGDRADAIERQLAASVAQEMGTAFDPTRFVPYVMMHEFEALLFSDCPEFARAIDRQHVSTALQEIRDSFANPEEIDDSPDTAPSKRIGALVPGYQKATMGTLAALEIGLQAMRDACPHFSVWLNGLEAVGGRRGARA